ncbi:hypothetical protein NB063_18580 [Rhodopirellula sp. ICT_H3.1]|uniref:Uncharacterized protein n=2 Tax=Aporhodopirellula aestuarii TaxID=2950107 RepID=A0ABT0U6P8_9BACT|nr:hypothetical protein [Aporhodopirellula aestuarii]
MLSLPSNFDGTPESPCITSASHAGVIRQLYRAELDRWLESSGEPSIELDTVDIHRAAKQDNHLFPLPYRFMFISIENENETRRLAPFRYS